jgi:hypothetical protein
MGIMHVGLQFACQVNNIVRVHHDYVIARPNHKS